MRDAHVVLDRVSKDYGTGAQKVTALTDVSLSIAAGEFVSVMGASGSGKSSLLNLVAGLDLPTAGEIVTLGQRLEALSDDERSDMRLRHLGFVFQSFNLFPTFTVEENVAWPLEFLGQRWKQARGRAAAALGAVGLDAAVLPRRPSELSGGEQQRVAIARALVTEPKLLLADEPTGNLDSRTGLAVLELLRSLNQERGLTVVMVTHSTLAATHGDRTIEMRDGRILREVSAPAAPSRPNLALFGGG